MGVTCRREHCPRTCRRQAHCLAFPGIIRHLVKYMQRVLVTEQTLCGDSRLQATATTVRYTRCTGMLSSCMGRSFNGLVVHTKMGASLILSSRRYSERLYDAGLKARFHKGLCRLYTARWSRALSFATKSTYLLGRRIANLRPAFTGVCGIKEVS